MAGVSRVVRPPVCTKIDGDCGADIYFVTKFFENLPGVWPETITAREVSDGLSAEGLGYFLCEQAQFLCLQVSG